MSETPTPPTAAIYKHMLRGSLWAILMRWCIRLVGLVSTMILARLLTPEDFGLVAMGALIVGLLDGLMQLGSTLLLMREPEISREHCDTAWTIRLLQAVAMALVLVVTAPLAARYFGEPRVVDVCYVQAVWCVLIGLQNIGMVLATRNLDFAREFRFNVYSKLIGFAATVPLAFALRTYWALLLGQLISGILDVLVTYRMHPYRPRLSLKRAGPYIRFSMAMVPLNTGGYLARKIDTLVIGRIGPASVLGTYNVAAELSTMATVEIATQIGRALYPSYAKLTSHPRALAEVFAQSLAAVGIVSIAIGAGLAVVAEDFVRIVLGSQWGAVVPLLQWLAVLGCVRSITQVMGGSILIVSGHERLAAMTTWIRLAIAAPAVIGAAYFWGASAVPPAATFAAMLGLPIVAYYLTRAMPLTLMQIARALWKPVIAAAAMAAAVRLLHFETSAPLPVLRLATEVAVGATVFTIVQASLWWLTGKPAGPEQAILNVLVRRRPT